MSHNIWSGYPHSHKVFEGKIQMDTATPEVQQLEAEVLRAAREWGKELQRINGTTYTQENKRLAVVDSIQIILVPVNKMINRENA